MFLGAHMQGYSLMNRQKAPTANENAQQRFYRRGRWCTKDIALISLLFFCNVIRGC